VSNFGIGDGVRIGSKEYRCLDLRGTGVRREFYGFPLNVGDPSSDWLPVSFAVLIEKGVPCLKLTDEVERWFA
jgi:hypothetical protein